MQVETRPSGAARWTKCSAAPLFASRSPVPKETDPAREGTCAAWVAEMVLTGKCFSAFDLVGEFHSNGWEVDAEMAAHVNDYVDLIRSRNGVVDYAEKFVRLSPRVAGTLDNASIVADGVLWVTDLKYGFRLIEPDTPQIVIYAGAFLQELFQAGTHIHTVKTSIYQPRGFHSDGAHRVQTWTPQEILARCEWIAARAEECYQPEPLATPGPHCRDCGGILGCVASANAAAALFELAVDTRHRQPTTTEVAQQIKMLRQAKKALDARVSAVEAEAEARHKAGDYLPGFGFKERLGIRKFHVSAEAIEAVTGVKPVIEKPMTPAELERAGVDKKVVDLVARRPSIGFKLEPLDPKDLEKLFSKGTQNE